MRDSDMLQMWSRQLEQIALPVMDGDIRVLGFTSTEVGSGVSSICSAIAQTLTLAGSKVIVVDFTQRLSAATTSDCWLPGQSNTAELIRRHPSGYDVLTARISHETRFRFINAKKLRDGMLHDLSGYTAILVDLPPLTATSSDICTPVAPALSCDSVLLICVGGKTRRSAIKTALNIAQQAGIHLKGVVFNTIAQPSQGQKLTERFKKMVGFAPGLSRALDRHVR